MKGYVCRQCNILLLEALHNARHSSTMLPSIERTDFPQLCVFTLNDHQS